MLRPAAPALLCRLLSALCAIALLASCNRIDTRPLPSGPNVLLVTIDTLRADYVGAYHGRKTETPTLDALAREGALFENASATVPLTLPSHASILTGQYPPRHGVRHNSIHMLASASETVAERFQAAGYSTAAFVAAAVLGRSFGLDQGFDTYHDDMSDRLSGSSGFAQLSATQISDEVIDWLSHSDRPFFVWAHYYDVHARYEPPEPYLSRLAPDRYAGEVAYVDHELGRIVAALRKSGRYENTLIVVTSDHGEGLGEHGEATHTYLIYESTMHVPLIVRGPGIPANARIADVVSNASIAPTLATLAKLGALAQAEVADLSPLLRGEKGGDGWAYSESLAGQLDHGWAPIRAIRSPGEKYIQAPRPELFDLASDPREERNLLGEHAGAHAPRVAAAEQHIATARTHEASSSGVAIDAATRAQIAALGYVVPSGTQTASANAPDPKDMEKHAQLAFRAGDLVLARRWPEAEQALLASIANMPTSATLHESLARVYLATGRKQEALAAAQQATRLAPDSPWSYLLLGELKLQVGDFAGGIAAMERALELDPNQPGAHLALMLKVKFGGSIEEAEAHAKRGLELGGDRPGFFEAAGEAWEMAGEYDRALATYQAGVERAPEGAERLHMRLAIQYARLGDEEAFAEHVALAGDAAHDVRLALRLAIAWAARGDHARAEPLLRALVMRDTTHIAPRVLARLLRETGRSAEAERIAPAGAPALRMEPILDGLGRDAVPRG